MVVSAGGLEEQVRGGEDADEEGEDDRDSGRWVFSLDGGWTERSSAGRVGDVDYVTLGGHLLLGRQRG